MAELFEAIIDERNFSNGIYAVSIVESPAIESEFIMLSADTNVMLQTVDDEKRLLLGAVLIPNKPIVRMDERGEKFHLYFSKPTVRRAMELFFIKNYQSNTTFEHDEKLNGLTMVESWIVENTDMDKSRHYGLTVPVGTWMAAMKVESPDMWSKIKKSGVRGFSIEGFFQPSIRRLSATQMSDEMKLEQIKRLIGI